MDYAKNFKTKNIILRVIAFVFYFFAAGFIGRLCVILLEPFFSVFLKPFPVILNIILYIISAAAMFISISFFSKREGYNDTELLRFSYFRTAVSYIISGLIFYSVILSVIVFKNYYIYYDYGKIITTITDYFFFPFFLPDEITYLAYNFVSFSNIPVVYDIIESIKSFVLIQWVNLAFSVILCIVLNIIFYKKGRIDWIEKKKKKIEQAKQINK